MTRTRWWVMPAAILLSVAATGCVEPLKPPGWFDASIVDAGPDPDMDVDAGPDMGPPEPVERDCSDDIDNDGDGLTDCNDFDCDGDDDCCVAGGGSIAFEEGWTTADLTFEWDLVPSADPSLPTVENDGGGPVLVGWGTDAMLPPNALVRSACMPLALGAEFTFEAAARVVTTFPQCGIIVGSPTVPCPAHGALVLTAAGDAAVGARLLDELAIRVHADIAQVPGVLPFAAPAAVRITQGGGELASQPIEPERLYRFTLRVVPAATAGRATLEATLDARFADAAGGAPEFTLGPFEVTRQDALRTDGACGNIAGLNVAVEMVGAGAMIGPVTAGTLECANPSQFEEPGGVVDVVDSDSLMVPASFGGGGIGSPTITSAFNVNGATVARWDLFFEASNDPPELELSARVGYAIGHGATTVWSADASDWSVGPIPKLGDDPPSCVSGTCDTVSVRQPFALVERDSSDVLAGFRLTFAVERPDGNHELRIESDVPVQTEFPVTGLGAAPVVEPSSTCVDLGDPALFRVGASPAEGYWLVFRCDRDTGRSELWIAKLDSGFGLRPGAVAPLLVPDALSLDGVPVYALSSPEPLVRREQDGAGGPVLRMWFVARTLTGQTAVMLATAEPNGDETSFDTRPLLVPYPANPVLDSDAAALGGCAGATCSITSVAVAEDVAAANGDELRVVVARRVNTPDGSIMTELIPLSQLWRLP